MWSLTPEREQRWLHLAELCLQRRSLWQQDLLIEVFIGKCIKYLWLICFSPSVNIVLEKTLKDYIVSMWIDQVAGRLSAKIILHRIISVVWLTNFLSEILTQSTHDDELTSFLWAWRGGRALLRSVTLMIAHSPLEESGGGSCRLSGCCLWRESILVKLSSARIELSAGNYNRRQRLNLLQYIITLPT